MNPMTMAGISLIVISLAILLVAIVDHLLHPPPDEREGTYEREGAYGWICMQPGCPFEVKSNFRDIVLHVSAEHGRTHR